MRAAYPARSASTGPDSAALTWRVSSYEWPASQRYGAQARAGRLGAGSGLFLTTMAGAVQLEPNGSGWRWLASALWGEILLSQQAGTWRRIKRCHNHRCGSTFYDRSKNTSGVWHDVKTSGNAANLRASRARRRERERAISSARHP